MQGKVFSFQGLVPPYQKLYKNMYIQRDSLFKGIINDLGDIPDLAFLLALREKGKKKNQEGCEA